jgi:putative transposase
MLGERGVSVDHSTINRWAVRFLPLIVWKYLYRAVDKDGKTNAGL